ncbi:hypothetical protein [Paenibacillus sp. FSL R7-0652]|uniref:hypothetical protein n=1 Tax=Paenibacillus sp. FSL R7-0652 TaxID=2921687 RepID=UPI00315A6D5E
MKRGLIIFLNGGVKFGKDQYRGGNEATIKLFSDMGLNVIVDTVISNDTRAE